MNWMQNLKACSLLAAIIAAFLWAQHDDHGHEFAQADELTAVQAEEKTKASREAAARAMCGEGLASWVDETTVHCTPRRGKTYSVAGVQP